MEQGTFEKMTSKETGVLLHETITMKSPDLLFNYAFKPAETTHEEMLKKTKNFVEDQ